MIISAIVAASKNGVIGKDGGLPWRLPDELKYFKKMTVGKTVIMGRKTYDSIGKPLPDRLNIVLTHTPFEGPCLSAGSLYEALSYLDNSADVMIIGGASVYKAALPMCDYLYLTRVHVELEGDAYFDFNESEWELVESVDRLADERNNYDVTFEKWKRKS